MRRDGRDTLPYYSVHARAGERRYRELLSRASRPPAGHWPINQLWAWVVVAGSSLACTHCGVTGKAPLPSSGGYNAACEAFLEQHRRCAAERRP